MSPNIKHTARPKYKLVEVKLPGKSTPEKGKYRAIVTDRENSPVDSVRFDENI